MTIAPRVRASATLLALAGCSGDLVLPPRVAGSEYIDYHTDADASVICMDDLLAREDRFIERTAALLGVDPPPGTIDYVWEPAPDPSKPWACPATAKACYQHREEDDLSVVVSDSLRQHHELVHAIQVQSLRASGHQTLEEGLAEYLGTLQQSFFAPGEFPGAFKAMLAASPTPSDYKLAMHFVGSIFARHGAEKYRALHTRMPVKARPEEFAAVFEAVYGQSLDAALAEMSEERVYAIDLFAGCGDGEAPELVWSSDTLLEATIDGACGDPWFFGGGFVDGRAGFFGLYTVEVPQAGDYELTVGAVAGGPAPLSGLLTACSFEKLESAAASLRGQTGRARLQPGRHTLAIAFPAGPEARGEATVRLAHVGPPEP